MINRNQNINQDRKYRIKKIEDNLITITHNNNKEDYEKIIIYYRTQTKEQMGKLKKELRDLKLNQNIKNDMNVNLENNWKVPEKIIKRIPKEFLIRKVIEILYSHWGKILELRTVKYIK